MTKCCYFSFLAWALITKLRRMKSGHQGGGGVDLFFDFFRQIERIISSRFDQVIPYNIFRYYLEQYTKSYIKIY
jgi:hypothetical protein